MKRSIIIFLICSFLNVFCAKSTIIVNYEVIPLPQQIDLTRDAKPFALNAGTRISYTSNEMKETADLFAADMLKYHNIKLGVSDKKISINCIFLVLDHNLNLPNDEGYIINVTQNSIRVSGRSVDGVRYGLQTLIKSISVSGNDGKSVLFPAVKITDYPRFKLRGMMLDVARHYASVDFIKKYIDILALHNMNYFHIHLTDDQGWRIEIKKYPGLVNIGSVRKGTKLGKSEEYDGIVYGGHYTQAELKSIVRYAEFRGITVIPEIDIPGHMLAALAAYPHLGCTGGPYEVWQKWGVSDDMLCMGNEEVYTFLEDVFSELLDIFPSKYIHAGGDECPTHRWKECSKCQAKLKKLRDIYNDPEANESLLQAYCVERINKFLNSKGRIMIGWDEIVNDHTPDRVAIMSWHGLGGGFKAAKKGLDAFMVPSSHLYFDFYQTRNIDNVPIAIGGYTPLEKVYSLNPIPEGLTSEEQKHIIAVQANQWTEYMTNTDIVEYMLMPRIDALAEVQWTLPDKKNYQSFLKRLPSMLDIYRNQGYKYAKHIYDVVDTTEIDTNKEALTLSLSTLDGGEIYYSLNDEKQQLYRVPITITKSTKLNAETRFSNGEKGLPLFRQFNFNKASLKPIEVEGDIAPAYRYAGAKALIDGLRGGQNYGDGNWIGFLGEQIKIDLNLKRQENISSVGLGTYININDWIFGVTGIEIEVSTDGITYKEVYSSKFDEVPESQPIGRVDINTTFDQVKAQYVRIKIDKTSHLSAWHPRTGHRAYLFIDEIVVN